MNPFHWRVTPVAVLCLAPLLPALAEAPDPAGAAPGAPLRYRSAFAGYKPLEDGKPGDWRSLNDAVKDGAPPMPKAASAPGNAEARAPAAAAPMPGMKGMPGMGGHAHAMPGGKP